MKRGRVMIIGSIGAGKSTLIRSLFGDRRPALKTQALEYTGWLIDTPGEYTENPMYYRSLMATALEAAAVVLVQDATKDRPFFPPGFAQGFPIPAVGVITKTDHQSADVERAEVFLRNAMQQGDIYITSAILNEGIDDLRIKLLKFLDPKYKVEG